MLRPRTTRAAARLSTPLRLFATRYVRGDWSTRELAGDDYVFSAVMLCRERRYTTPYALRESSRPEPGG